jgi:ubiquinone/menaquinone biosynthesis C-methylase UbiE
MSRTRSAVIALAAAVVALILVRVLPWPRVQVPEMEGRAARWYARQRGSASQLVSYRSRAAQVTAGLAAGAAVLEVAPGPGYHAIELARLGFRVTGLDISHTMVEIAVDNARTAGVSVDFRHGDVAGLPFDADSFDLVVCQAAFKNFHEPVRALDEMHRVLRPGATAIIDDLDREASSEAVADEARRSSTNRLNELSVRWTLGTFLRRRAYTRETFERLAAQSDFGSCEVRAQGIGLEVRLTKQATT